MGVTLLQLRISMKTGKLIDTSRFALVFLVAWTCYWIAELAFWLFEQVVQEDPYYGEESNLHWVDRILANVFHYFFQLFVGWSYHIDIWGGYKIVWGKVIDALDSVN